MNERPFKDFPIRYLEPERYDKVMEVINRKKEAVIALRIQWTGRKERITHVYICKECGYGQLDKGTCARCGEETTEHTPNLPMYSPSTRSSTKSERAKHKTLQGARPDNGHRDNSVFQM